MFGKSRNRIRREAADWVARLGDRPSDQQLRDLQRWQDADPRHAEAYARISRIWNAAGRIAPEREPMPTQESRPAAAQGGAWLALAASLAALAAIVSAVLLSARPVHTEPPERLIFATAIGEIRQVDLPDGSRLVVDSSSRLEASFSRTERRLALLEGRVRFRVAAGERPFIVRAADSEVVARGTLFDVNLLSGGAAVLPLEGSVEVRPASAPAGRFQRLVPGERLLLTSGAPPVRARASRGEARWPSRMLEFEDTPLAEAVELVNRYSRVRLRLADAGLGQRRVTGAYRAGDVAGFARGVAAMWDLRLETRPDGGLLLSRPVRTPR